MLNIFNKKNVFKVFVSLKKYNKLSSSSRNPSYLRELYLKRISFYYNNIVQICLSRLFQNLLNKIFGFTSSTRFVVISAFWIFYCFQCIVCSTQLTSEFPNFKNSISNTIDCNISIIRKLSSN